MFFVQDLGVDDAGVVIDSGVDVAVARSGSALNVAPTVSAPAATVGDASDLLGVDMDQLVGPVALIAHDGFFGGPVTRIEAPGTFGVQMFCTVDGERPTSAAMRSAL